MVRESERVLAQTKKGLGKNQNEVARTKKGLEKWSREVGRLQKGYYIYFLFLGV